MDKKIKQALISAFTQLPHTDAEQIWKIPVKRMEEHDYITRQEVKPGISYGSKKMQFAAAAACLFLSCFVTVNWYQQNRVTSMVVALDINPGFELALNKKNKVLSIVGCNDDAKEILKTVKIEGKDAKNAMDTLLVTLKDKKYLGEQENAVLLSVNIRGKSVNPEIGHDMMHQIHNLMDSEKTPVTVIYQSFSNKSRELSKAAAQYHISIGKMDLITDIAASYPEYTLEHLSGLPIEELLELTRKLKNEMPDHIEIEETSWKIKPGEKETDTGKEKDNGKEKDAGKEKGAAQENPVSKPHSPIKPAPQPAATPVQNQVPERDRDDDGDDDSDDRIDGDDSVTEPGSADDDDDRDSDDRPDSDDGRDTDDDRNADDAHDVPDDHDADDVRNAPDDHDTDDVRDAPDNHDSDDDRNTDDNRDVPDDRDTNDDRDASDGRDDDSDEDDN